MPSPLNDLSDSLAQIVRSLEPVLLRVPGFRGSATAIPWGEGNLAVTTARIALRRDAFAVQRPDPADPTRLIEVQATVRGRAPGLDLALLEIAGEPMPLPAWATADTAVQAGNLVGIIGRPSHRVEVGLGVVKSVGGPWQSPHGGTVDRAIDVEGELPWGYAGGPLVSANGEILGLNTRSLKRGGTTLPAETVDRVAAELRDHGSVQQAWLGISGIEVPLPEGLITGVQRGVMLTSVDADGPAARAGLFMGDTLLCLGETPTPTLRDVIRALGANRPGATQPLTLLRTGQPVELPVTLGVRPPTNRRAPEQGRVCR